MKKIFLILILATVSGQFVPAQDVHFSQFYYSPSTLNPALTGAIDGTFRFSGICHNQWSSYTVPVVHSFLSVAADAKLFSRALNHNFLGVGFSVIRDRFDDGNFKNLTSMLSLAYHQALNSEGNYHLAIGLQGGLVDKSFRLSNVKYQVSVMDFAAGALLYGTANDHTRFQIGGSVFHLTTPSDAPFEISDEVIDMRYVIHGSLTLQASRRIYLFPFAQYQVQNNDNEMVYGSNFGYNFSSSVTASPKIFYFGIFNRLSHDIIPTAGIMMNGLKAGISYDINISSDLNPSSESKRGFEVALSYMGNIIPSVHLKGIFSPQF